MTRVGSQVDRPALPDQPAASRVILDGEVVADQACAPLQLGGQGEVMKVREVWPLVAVGDSHSVLMRVRERCRHSEFAR